jgi:hypothetical protein
MALKETISQLHELLDCVSKDLEKGSKGNKAASQRVRTGTVKLEKIAKLYRKQSVANEKTNKTKKAKPATAKPKAQMKKEPAKKSHPEKKKK